MAHIVPSELTREGWVLEAPPTPRIERPATCDKQSQGCDTTCVQKKKASLTPVNYTSICDLCMCRLCYVCANPINRWTSPTGQTIETLTTHTQPRFTFAYNPFDDDMKRMRRTHIVEPRLTHAWFKLTNKCCNSSNGFVVDVGGNFGWYVAPRRLASCSASKSDALRWHITLIGILCTRSRSAAEWPSSSRFLRT